MLYDCVIITVQKFTDCLFHMIVQIIKNISVQMCSDFHFHVIVADNWLL